MKLLRSLTLFTVLAGTTAAYADKAPAPAPTGDKKPAPPVEKKAPDAPAPAAKEEISAADGEKFLAFFNKIADAFVANKDDCTKLAAAINKLTDQNQDILKHANEAKMAGKKLPKAIEDKMMKRVMSDVAPAMQKCQADKGVMEAMQRMDGKAKDAAPAKDAKTPPAKDAKTPPAKDAKAPDAKTPPKTK